MLPRDLSFAGERNRSPLCSPEPVRSQNATCAFERFVMHCGTLGEETRLRWPVHRRGTARGPLPVGRRCFLKLEIPSAAGPSSVGILRMRFQNPTQCAGIPVVLPLLHHSVAALYFAQHRTGKPQWMVLKLGVRTQCIVLKGSQRCESAVLGKEMGHQCEERRGRCEVAQEQIVEHGAKIKKEGC